MKLVHMILGLTILTSSFVSKASDEYDNEEGGIEIETYALSQELLDGDKKVKSGDTLILPLENIVTVDRLAIELDKKCLCQQVDLVVSFDGREKHSLRVNRADADNTTHLINVGRIVSTIEIKNVGRCGVEIEKITLLPRRLFAPQGPGGHWGHPYLGGGEARASVGYLLEIFRALDRLVSAQDRLDVIAQGKVVFGKAQATLATYPETSWKSIEAVEGVVEFLSENQDFIEELQTIEVTFALATQIQSLHQLLERMLD